MTQCGTSIIFINDENKVLLLLRDNYPHIKYPNTWDIPGGQLEKKETPEGCIVREMNEEMGLNLIDFQLFEQRQFPDRLEYTFWKRLNLDVGNIVLTEGQELRWFSYQEASVLDLAFGFNITIENFFKSFIYRNK